MQVAKHKVVAIDYTLKDDDGETIDTSDGQDPLVYLHGEENIIPGLESALEGRAVGDSVQVSVQPAEGYGERNESLVQEIPRSSFEGVPEIEVGMQFRVPVDDGEIVVMAVEVTDQSVTVDGNHALAGINLNFDVTVREIRDASAEEIAHGHVHGPGGHAH